MVWFSFRAGRVSPRSGLWGSRYRSQVYGILRKLCRSLRGEPGTGDRGERSRVGRGLEGIQSAGFFRDVFGAPGRPRSDIVTVDLASKSRYHKGLSILRPSC